MRLFAVLCITIMAQPDPQMWLFKTRSLNQRPVRDFGAYGDSHNDRTYYKRDPFNMDQYML